MNKANGSPVSPFTNGWASAADNIQTAIDVSVSGDIILVTNGVYNTGGANGCRVYMPNGRVVTVKAVSTNPADTLIVGAADMVGGSPSNGPAAVRCVRIYTSGNIEGFTLTNGWTPDSGVMVYGAGAYVEDGSAVFSNCVITSCRAASGGGASRRGKFIDCTISGNTAGVDGGGVSFGQYIRCVVSNNVAGSTGGGGWACWATDSLIIGNRSGGVGGGLVAGGALDQYILRCRIINNFAGGAAGGLNGLSATNCLIAGNTANNGNGGGMQGGRAVNCTIVSNVASVTQGGIAGGESLTNCIVYGNLPGNVKAGSTYNISYSCVATNGIACTIVGDHNTTNNPLFVDLPNGDYHLTSRSPCVNAGTNQDWMTNGVDQGGLRRLIDGIVDMGAYEFLPKGTVITILGSPVP